jgi:hypothetical protein
MTTTGTTSFNLDLANLMEEAFERAGGEIRSGYDVRTARRSLNLLTIEWANRGINLWTIEQGQIQLNQGQIAYNYPVDTIDLLDQVVRTQTGIDQTDINISRISVSTYATIPNKNAQGRPIQVWINRQSGTVAATDLTLTTGGIGQADTTITLSGTPTTLPQIGYINLDSETIQYSGISGNTLTGCLRGQNNTTAASHVASTKVYLNNLPCINVWPTPNQDNFYTFVYWRLKRLNDAGNGRTEQDIPFRLMPCLVAGLAYYIAMKIPEGQARLDRLKLDYEEQWLLSSSEDREKAALRIAPRQMFI